MGPVPPRCLEVDRGIVVYWTGHQQACIIPHTKNNFEEKKSLLKPAFRRYHFWRNCRFNQAFRSKAKQFIVKLSQGRTVAKRQPMRAERRKSAKWKVYLPSILILVGILILIIIILQPYKQYGLFLSVPQKFIVIVLAVIIILSGFYLKSSPGAHVLSAFSGLSMDEIRLICSRRSFHFLEYSIVLMGFFMVFCLYQDEKSAVLSLDIPRFYNDTPSYLETSSFSLNDIHIWAGKRPFTVPLFYKLIGYTLANFQDQNAMNRVAGVQGLISILSWTILAGSFSMVIKDRFVKVIGFATLLLLGTSIDITSWDKEMLTESISTSFLVVFLATIIIAGLLWDQKRPISAWIQFFMVSAILMTGIFYSFARDQNAYFILFMGALMVFGVAFVRIRMHPLFFSYLVVMTGFLSVFILQNTSANLGRRFEGAIKHIISDRIVPSLGNLDYYIQQGMPFDDTVARMASGDFHHGVIPYSSNAMPQFLKWVSTHGKTVTMKFLLSHPLYTLSAPWQDFWEIVNSNNHEYRKVRASPNFRVALFSAIMYPQSKWIPCVFAILFILTLLTIWKNSQGKSIWYLALALFITTYPMALFVWHADTYEIRRHAYQVAFQLRLASWIVIVLLLERWAVVLKRHPVQK